MKLTVMQQDELSEEEFSEENSNEGDSSGEDLVNYYRYVF